MRLIVFLLLTTSLFATDYNGVIDTWGYGDLVKNSLEAHYNINSTIFLKLYFK